MFIRLPIPFPNIKNADDRQVVSWLLDMIGWATNEFLYGKCYPIFKSLHVRFYTDCPDIIDFIHEIYIDIISPRKTSNICKLQTFDFRSTLYTWMGVLSSRYCYSKFKRQIYTESLNDGDRKFDIMTSNNTKMEDIFDKEDVIKILGMITNDRYRQIIRLHYLEGKSNEETADLLNLSMDVYYNKHRLAKVRFITALKMEGLL